jgi:hypothetical protein
MNIIVDNKEEPFPVLAYLIKKKIKIKNLEQ